MTLATKLIMLENVVDFGFMRTLGMYFKLVYIYIFLQVFHVSLGTQPSSIPIGSLGRAISQGKLVENSGTKGAPSRHRPLLLKKEENTIFGWC
jgi:hypothetical protein